MKISNSRWLSFSKEKAKVFILRYFSDLLAWIDRRRLKSIFDNSDSMVIIYTIGKVASTAVYDSLIAHPKLNKPVFHIHCLNNGRIIEQKAYYKGSKKKSFPFHLIRGQVISEFLPSYKGKVFLITLVREPIARELSSLFQDSLNFSTSLKSLNSEMSKVVESKFRAMVNQLPEDEWFSRELLEVFDIDIYNLAFEVSKGYCIKSDGSLIFGLIRLENLQDRFDPFCRELFGINLPFHLVNSNLGEDKFYVNAYHEVGLQTKFSSEDVSSILNTKFVKHFYSDLTEVIKSRWER